MRPQIARTSLGGAAMVIAIFCFIAAVAGLAGIAAEPDSAPEARKEPWELYLYYTAERIDCHFTMEVIRWKGDDPAVAPQFVEPDETVKSVDELIAKLRRDVRGYRFVPSKRNAKIIHVVAEELCDLPEYPIRSRITIQYSGYLDNFAEAIETIVPKLGPRRAGVLSDALIGDARTTVDLDVRNERVRDVLTDCVPLEGYNAVLWIANLEHEDHSPITKPLRGEFKTVVQYYGPRRNNSGSLGPKTSEKLDWQDYLEVVGKRLGCHFTIEVVKRGRHTIHAWVSDDENVKTLDALIEKMSDALPGFSFIENDRRPKVVHVIEDELFVLLDDYALDKKVTVAFRGTMDGLSRELKKQVPNIGPKESGNDDSVTDVEIDAEDERIRDILTDCVPLKSYRPIIWRAETSKVKERSTTTVQYYGPAK